MRGEQGVTKLDIELVIVDVVQEHIHPRQIVGGVVDFLTEEPLFDDMRVELSLGLQQQRTGTAGGVVDLVDAGLFVHGEPGDQAGDMLRSKELAARFAGIGGVVGDQKFVSIAKEVDMTLVESAEIELSHPFEHRRQTGVFLFDGMTQTVAGGIEIGKEPLDILFGRVATGGGFNGGKDGGQIGVQAFVAVGTRHDVDKQLAWVDKIALGLDGIILDFG